MYETLIDPPNEFAPKELPPLMLKALQLENAKSLTRTDTPLADVSPHLLLLLLEILSVTLQEYAPTYNTLIDPPYEFTPKVLKLVPSSLMLDAMQFQHTDLLTCTDTPLAWVASQLLLVILDSPLLKLHAYAPTYNTLIDPPYEFAPNVLAPRLMLEALQFRHAELLTCTDRPLADVASHLLLLLLDAAMLKLHEYAPTYNTLIDPPYEFTPNVLAPRLMLEALQFRHAELLTCTDTPLADVSPHLLLLLLEASSLKLHAYAPTYNTLIDPPYEFTP
jgi:hypothetical protein